MAASWCRPASVALLALYLACSSDSTGESDIPVFVSISPDSLELISGLSHRLTAHVYDGNYDEIDHPVSWSSDQPNVCVVATSGVVTGGRVGVARITASAENASGRAEVWVRPGSPTRIDMGPKYSEIIPTEVVQLSASVMDAEGNYTEARFDWASSDTEVATVDAEGLVTGVAPGTTFVTARAEELADSAEIKVKQPFSLKFPLIGELNKDFYYNNYVDQTYEEGILDYNCGLKTYDGHRGTDITLPSFARMDRGIPIVAAAPGTVVVASDGHPDRNKERGGLPANRVAIMHDQYFMTIYSHMAKNSVAVSVDQAVETGDLLGMVGSSGNSTMPHLHLEILRYGVPVDPFEGPCGAAFSLWEDPHAYQDQFKLIASGTTNQEMSIDLAKDPPAQVDVFRATDPNFFMWVQLINVREGARSTFRLYGPDGSVQWDSTFEHSRFYSMSWWWMWFDVQYLMDMPGTWQAYYYNDGDLLAQRSFTVVDDGSDPAKVSGPPRAGFDGGGQTH